MKRLWCVLSLACSCFTIYGRQPLSALGDQNLAGMFRQLLMADGYSYRVTVESTVPGSTKQRKTEQTINYQSKTAFIIYSKSEDGLFFMSRDGQFRVDFKTRKAYYRKFETDSISRLAQQTILQNQLTQHPDSFFLKDAQVVTRKEAGQVISYTLKYKPASLLRSMSVTYRKNGFFNSISYSLDRPVTHGASPIILTQRVTMARYEQKMPAELTGILAAGTDIRGYLEANYKGFTLSGVHSSSL